ncbi:transposase domain-containing protein [Pseudomonas sp. MYb193]|uniref:transposase domain-containing protein n=1 Tax=Pseudomonas sp. MYb193 TaxID=1827300 RepID=UPI00353249F1
MKRRCKCSCRAPRKPIVPTFGLTPPARKELEPDIRRRIRQEKAVPVGHDPYAYQKDVLTRLPTQRASEIAELLPHRWRPA